ncbi:hypothetical protein A8C32_04980 [Flavivirga aquatica]|uniref:Secretion system C-terminal sorting domain-containing protein n=1 Tax=Flavivirga aquatica TaxID=1849968 RepID=A0A1E5SHG3_9FLAO|nr:right-handed parallel beta-helix repeat-containing protein [Flavivirga aquatica]OEJ98559.1 hypothetical protein A8C32_04980 [Flavivirga aquatica]
MKKSLLFEISFQKIVVMLAIIFTSSISAKNIYVSKTGNDTNPGTIDKPYKTITKASSVARPGDIVVIGQGTYEETIRPVRSGTPGQPITYTAKQGEKVIISAMQALSGWTSDGDGRWKTKVNWDLGQRNFVMRGKTVLDLARWPNNTDGDRFTLNSLRNDDGSQDQVSVNAFLTDREIPNWNWSNGGSIMFYGDRPGSGWTTWRAWIKRQSSGRVVFDAIKDQSWIIGSHPPGDKGDYFLEGIKEALDYKNEWYFNPKTKTLFVKLPKNAEPKNGEVQMARRSVTADLQNLNYIHLQNIALFGGNILIKGIGNKLNGITSLYGSMTRGITPKFNSGINAVDIKSGSRNTVIENSEIAFGDATGVWDAGTSSIIRNNYIHDFNFLGSYDAPIMARGGVNTKIIRNNISRGGRDAIQIINKNSEVAYNDVSYSNLIADDCALIYTINKGLNMDIHHNWFHDAKGRGKLKKAAGIYLDNDAENVRVYRNVVWNVEWTNVQINWNGKDIDIFNNTLVKAQGGTMGAWHKKGTKFTNVKVWNNITDRNATDQGGNQETEGTWEPQSNKQNNLVDNKSFVNHTNNNYKLKPGSKAVDFGRVINRYTDNYVGKSPDVGAYEIGDNWVPGPNWDIAQGPTGQGCYGLPGESCGTNAKDNVEFVNVPTTLPVADSYTVDVTYEASINRELVVEFWSATGWIASSAVQTVSAGKETKSITIQLPKPVKPGKGYVFKTHIRPVGGTWQQALKWTQLNDITVEAVPQFKDEISFKEPKTTLVSADSYVLDIAYEASINRELVVEFWSSSGWVAQQKEVVSAGKGVKSITVQLPKPAQSGIGYIFKTHIRPLGANWTQAIDRDQVNNVTIIGGGKKEEKKKDMLFNIDNLRISSNPVKEKFTIHNLTKPVLIQVSNLKGQKVLSKVIDKYNSIDVSSYKQGIYFISINNSPFTKFLKQ